MTGIVVGVGVARPWVDKGDYVAEAVMCRLEVKMAGDAEVEDVVELGDDEK